MNKKGLKLLTLKMLLDLIVKFLTIKSISKLDGSVALAWSIRFWRYISSLGVLRKISGFPFPSEFCNFFQTEQTVNRKKSGFRAALDFVK